MGIDRPAPPEIARSATQPESALARPEKRDAFQETVDGLNQALVEAKREGRDFPPVQFGDVQVSLQVGRSCYSRPRSDDAERYTHVELGFPNKVPPDYILEYAESPHRPTETVYGYVPIELVVKWAQEERQAKALPAPEEE